MSENQGARLIGILNGLSSSPPTWVEGVVSSVSPLTVIIGDHVLQGRDLLANYSLLHTSVLEERVRQGDKVALFPNSDGQVFLVIAKVVDG